MPTLVCLGMSVPVLGMSIPAPSTQPLTSLSSELFLLLLSSLNPCLNCSHYSRSCLFAISPTWGFPMSIFFPFPHLRRCSSLTVTLCSTWVSNSRFLDEFSIASPPSDLMQHFKFTWVIFLGQSHSKALARMFEKS